MQHLTSSVYVPDEPFTHQFRLHVSLEFFVDCSGSLCVFYFPLCVCVCLCVSHSLYVVFLSFISAIMRLWAIIITQIEIIFSTLGYVFIMPNGFSYWKIFSKRLNYCTPHNIFIAIGLSKLFSFDLEISFQTHRHIHSHAQTQTPIAIPTVRLAFKHLVDTRKRDEIYCCGNSLRRQRHFSNSFTEWEYSERSSIFRNASTFEAGANQLNVFWLVLNSELVVRRFFVLSAHFFSASFSHALAQSHIRLPKNP